MKRLAPILLLLGLLLPAASGATVREETLKSRMKAWAAGQEWSLYSGYSLVTFADPVWEEVLQKDSLPMLRFGGGWYPLPNLALDVAVGGMYEEAESIGSISGQGSGETFTLLMIPVELGVRYRFKFLDNQLLVPSAFAAYEWWYFKEDPQGGGDVIEGDHTGFRYGADLGLLLNPLDPTSAYRFRRDYGVTATYLCLGYEVLSMNADSGLDFSGNLFTLSLRFDLEPDRAHAKP